MGSACASNAWLSLESALLEWLGGSSAWGDALWSGWPEKLDGLGKALSDCEGPVFMFSLLASSRPIRERVLSLNWSSIRLWWWPNVSKSGALAWLLGSVGGGAIVAALVTVRWKVGSGNDIFCSSFKFSALLSSNFRSRAFYWSFYLFPIICRSFRLEF